MDTVTQVLLGAAIGEAGFGRKLGKKALVFGGLCGLFPDLDILADWVNPWAQFTFHRSVTHSLLVLPILALLFGWIAWKTLGGRGSPKTWIHLAFWALVTHPLLDICTSYGTQIFWPLSHRRVSLDGVASIDLIYSLPLAAVALLGLFRRKDPRKHKKWTWAALSFTTAYLCLGVYLGVRASAASEKQLLASGFRPVETRATPTMLNLFLRRVVARDPRGNIRVGYYSLTAPRPVRWTRLDLPDDPLVRKALESKGGKRFAWFAQGMVWASVDRTPKGAVVTISDERYGMGLDPGRAVFKVKAYFDGNGRLTEVRPLDRDLRTNYIQELRLRWRLLWGK